MRIGGHGGAQIDVGPTHSCLEDACACPESQGKSDLQARPSGVPKKSDKLGFAQICRFLTACP
jgi:hypothetical protein